MLPLNMTNNVGYTLANKPNGMKLIFALLNSDARKEKTSPFNA